MSEPNKLVDTCPYCERRDCCYVLADIPRALSGSNDKIKVCCQELSRLRSALDAAEKARPQHSLMDISLARISDREVKIWNDFDKKIDELLKEWEEKR